MKLSDHWKSYDFYTRDLTEHGRKLAFAAAAICWFFKSDQATFPVLIIWSLIFVVAFFVLDIVQYLSGALITRYWTRSQEVSTWKEMESLEVEVDKPATLDRLPFFLFLLKIGALLASFGFLISEFISRI